MSARTRALGDVVYRNQRHPGSNIYDVLGLLQDEGFLQKMVRANRDIQTLKDVVYSYLHDSSIVNKALQMCFENKQQKYLMCPAFKEIIWRNQYVNNDKFLGIVNVFTGNVARAAYYLMVMFSYAYDYSLNMCHTARKQEDICLYPSTLFHGTLRALPVELVNDIQRITTSSFLSTSLDKDVAIRYATPSKEDVKKGIKGNLYIITNVDASKLPMLEIPNGTAGFSEQEVILQVGLPLIVSEKSKYAYKYPTHRVIYCQVDYDRLHFMAFKVMQYLENTPLEISCPDYNVLEPLKDGGGSKYTPFMVCKTFEKMLSADKKKHSPIVMKRFVLGRERKVSRVGRKLMITYKGQQMTLGSARKLESMI